MFIKHFIIVRNWKNSFNKLWVLYTLNYSELFLYYELDFQFFYNVWLVRLQNEKLEFDSTPSQHLTLVILGEKPTFGAPINNECLPQCTEEGTLNAPETAVCNSFKNLLVHQLSVYLPLIPLRFMLCWNPLYSPQIYK